MKEAEREYYRKQVPKILSALTQKRYEACFFESAEEARQYIIDQIKEGEVVGTGGSVTLREDLGLVEALRNKGNTVIDHWEDEGNYEKRIDLKRKHRGVDVFLSSANAITEDGVIVNLDGGGNRVASTCSGPKRVILVAGLNKLVKTTDDAISRARNKVAPINAVRKNMKTPCAKTGVCIDCDSPARICAALLILLKKPGDIDTFTVILVNEEMGY